MSLRWHCSSCDDDMAETFSKPANSEASVSQPLSQLHVELCHILSFEAYFPDKLDFFFSNA